MNSLFEIKKTDLEKPLQNLNFHDLEHILDHVNQSFAIDLLSVDKNMKLLTKKADFDFLSKVFQKINSLERKNETFQFLRVSNEYFSNVIYAKSFNHLHKFSKLQEFIERVVDLSISHKKKHNLKELHKVISIGQSYQINNQKIVNWIGKITSYSNDTSLLEENTKLSLLQNKELRERYISMVINISQKPKFLDKLFNLYESNIYDLYANYKSNQRTWNCLLPKIAWDSYKYLPYVDSDKLNWLEEKHIGYKNNPVYFELHRLEQEFKHFPYSDDFKQKIETDYYQDLIYNSLVDYHKIYRFEKEKYFKLFISKSENEDRPERFIYSTEYSTFKDWIQSSPINSILSIYDKNKEFYDYCKKLKFKLYLEDKLVPSEKKEKKLKI